MHYAHIYQVKRPKGRQPFMTLKHGLSSSHRTSRMAAHVAAECTVTDLVARNGREYVVLSHFNGEEPNRVELNGAH